MAGRAGIRFTRPGQWALFKEHLARGSWEVRVVGELAGPGRIVLRDRTDPTAREWPLSASGTGSFALDRPEKAFVYLYAQEGSRVAAVAARRTAPREDEP